MRLAISVVSYYRPGILAKWRRRDLPMQVLSELALLTMWMQLAAKAVRPQTLVHFSPHQTRVLKSLTPERHAIEMLFFPTDPFPHNDTLFYFFPILAPGPQAHLENRRRRRRFDSSPTQ